MGNSKGAIRVGFEIEVLEDGICADTVDQHQHVTDGERADAFGVVNRSDVIVSSRTVPRQVEIEASVDSGGPFDWLELAVSIP